MISEEARGWLEILIGAGICLFVANRGRRGIFSSLRDRGEVLIGAMLMAIGVQTHLERLDAAPRFFHWIPIGLGVLGLALIIASKAGRPSPEAGEDDEKRPPRIPDAADPGIRIPGQHPAEKLHPPR